MGLVGLMPLGALYPSKSGLMNKHIVKQTNISTRLSPHEYTQTHRETYRDGGWRTGCLTPWSEESGRETESDGSLSKKDPNTAMVGEK